MVKIRLRRVGAKKQTSFRVVAADSRAPRDGRFIEEIGFYNPRTEPETLRIKEERALYWLSVGAQPSDSAARLLTSSGTLGRFERLKQGEDLETLVAEAEAPPVAEAEEEGAPEGVEEAEEAEPQEPAAEEPAAEGPVAEVETEEAGEEVAEAAQEAAAEMPAAETPTAEAEVEEAESEEDEPEPETGEAEEENEPQE